MDDLASAYSVRPYRPEDAQQLHAAALESAADVHPWMGWCHERYSIDEAHDWIAGALESARQGTAYEFAIFDQTDRYLGGCGINFINNWKRRRS